MEKKFNPELPVQTRDGRKARIICTDAKNKLYPVVALILWPDGEEEIETYTLEGRLCVGPERDRINDLINVPETKSWWMNVYIDGLYTPRSTRQEAEQQACKDRLSIIELRMCDGKLVNAIQHEVEK